jgi:hypothetical protein
MTEQAERILGRAGFVLFAAFLLSLVWLASQPPAPREGQQSQTPEAQSNTQGPQANGRENTPSQVQAVVVTTQPGPQEDAGDSFYQALANWGVFAATVAIAIFTWILARTSKRQWQSMERQAAAIEAQLGVSRDSLIATQRAQVYLKDVDWKHHQAGTVGVGPKRYTFTIRPVLENFGPTPTRDMTVVCSWKLVDKPLEVGSEFLHVAQPLPSHIGPHGSITAYWARITDDQMVAIQRGEVFFYIWGEAKYRDVFPNTPEHTTRFCRQMVNVFGNPRDPDTLRVGFFIHPEYNSAD